jgi:peptidoglycan/LPS O-acetylase OafA/YrhL
MSEHDGDRSIPQAPVEAAPPAADRADLAVKPPLAAMAPLAGSADRAPGLDTLRALAILLVFVYHYRVFVSREAGFGLFSIVGWVGVDLFFVLSGYLIAGQLLAGTVRGRALSLPAFYARRALRTLPLFWAVLAAYCLFPAAMGGREPPPLWRFLTFTQNFGLQPGTAFSHAWSLCIEEQFYLVLPALLLAGLRLRLGRRSGWALLGTLILLGMTARGVLWSRYGLESTGRVDDYYPWIYYATLCRFDEFLPGVAIAMLQHLHPDAWQRLTRHGRLLFAAGVAATAAVLYGAWQHYEAPGVGYYFFMTTFGYSLIAMAFGVLVLAALSPGNPLSRWRVPGAAALAAWSYAIYLSHKAVGVIVKRETLDWHPAPWLLFAAVATASLLVGWLLHRAVEMPFMRLRQRWVPSSFNRAAAAGDAGEPGLTQSAPASQRT